MLNTAVRGLSVGFSGMVASTVSVPWLGQKPDWNGSSADASSRTFWKYSAAALSITFPRNERFEIAQ